MNKYEAENEKIRKLIEDPDDDDESVVSEEDPFFDDNNSEEDVTYNPGDEGDFGDTSGENESDLDDDIAQIEDATEKNADEEWSATTKPGLHVR